MFIYCNMFNYLPNIVYNVRNYSSAEFCSFCSYVHVCNTILYNLAPNYLFILNSLHNAHLYLLNPADKPSYTISACPREL